MSRVKVATIGEVPDDTGLRVDLSSDRIALFRVDGDVYAIGDRCSHAEASLAEGYLYGHEVECPRHGSEFDVRSGAALNLPATKPVPTYTVEVDGDDIYLILEDS